MAAFTKLCLTVPACAWAQLATPAPATSGGWTRPPIFPAGIAVWQREAPYDPHPQNLTKFVRPLPSPTKKNPGKPMRNRAPRNPIACHYLVRQSCLRWVPARSRLSGHVSEETTYRQNRLCAVDSVDVVGSHSSEVWTQNSAERCVSASCLLPGLAVSRLQQNGSPPCLPSPARRDASADMSFFLCRDRRAWIDQVPSAEEGYRGEEPRHFSSPAVHVQNWGSETPHHQITLIRALPRSRPLVSYVCCIARGFSNPHKSGLLRGVKPLNFVQVSRGTKPYVNPRWSFGPLIGGNGR